MFAKLESWLNNAEQNAQRIFSITTERDTLAANVSALTKERDELVAKLTSIEAQAKDASAKLEAANAEAATAKAEVEKLKANPSAQAAAVLAQAGHSPIAGGAAAGATVTPLDPNLKGLARAKAARQRAANVHKA